MDTIPRPGKFIIFGLFLRVGLKLAAMMVCLSALGFSLEKIETPVQWIMMGWLFLEVSGLIYIYLNSNIYRDEVDTRDELIQDEKENEEWYKAHAPKASLPAYYLKEMLADLILQVYSVMIFTALWFYINRSGIEMIRECLKRDDSAIAAAFYVFPFLVLVSMLCIIPIRVAYWIEDSMMAYTRKEHIGMKVIFFFVAMFTCAPTIIKFFIEYYNHSSFLIGFFNSGYFNFYLTLLLLVMILAVYLVVANIRTAKPEIPESHLV